MFNNKMKLKKKPLKKTPKKPLKKTPSKSTGLKKTLKNPPLKSLKLTLKKNKNKIKGYKFAEGTGPAIPAPSELDLEKELGVTLKKIQDHYYDIKYIYAIIFCEYTYIQTQTNFNTILDHYISMTEISNIDKAYIFEMTFFNGMNNERSIKFIEKLEKKYELLTGQKLMGPVQRFGLRPGKWIRGIGSKAPSPPKVKAKAFSAPASRVPNTTKAPPKARQSTPPKARQSTPPKARQSASNQPATKNATAPDQPAKNATKSYKAPSPSEASTNDTGNNNATDPSNTSTNDKGNNNATKNATSPSKAPTNDTAEDPNKPADPTTEKNGDGDKDDKVSDSQSSNDDRNNGGVDGDQTKNKKGDDDRNNAGDNNNMGNALEMVVGIAAMMPEALELGTTAISGLYSEFILIKEQVKEMGEEAFKYLFGAVVDKMIEFFESQFDDKINIYTALESKMNSSKGSVDQVKLRQFIDILRFYKNQPKPIET